MINKGGRPSDYDKKYCELFIKASREGKSVTRFCADIGIAKSTFYLWVKTHDQFSNAFNHGKTYCEAKWEEWLCNNLDNKEVNSALVKLFFTNRFGWSEKIENNTNVTINQEEAIKELE